MNVSMIVSTCHNSQNIEQTNSAKKLHKLVTLNKEGSHQQLNLSSFKWKVLREKNIKKKGIGFTSRFIKPPLFDGL